MADPAPSSNADWFARAKRVIPGGVDSPVRSFASVGGTPVHGRAGRGPLRGRCRGHPLHRHGPVLRGRAARSCPPGRSPQPLPKAAALGTTFGAPTPGEVLLAEAICERVAGCEQVRLVSSGTEAAMSAVRLARGVTGRDRVVKFDGCYHGHSDGLLAGGGSGVATLGLPGSVGVPTGAVADTVVAALQRGAGAGRRGGLRHCRAGGGQHEPGGARPRLPGRVACGVRCRRRAADLRRGHHRLPARRRGCHRLVGRHA